MRSHIVIDPISLTFYNFISHQNSCGVLRYLVDHAPIGGRGWISSRIRGGKEEPIVEMLPVVSDDNEDGEDSSLGQPSHYVTPEDSAREWYASYLQVVKAASKNTSERDSFSESMNIETVQEFEDLLASGIISGITELDSDSLIAATYEKITDALPHRLGRGSSFVDCAIVLSASQPNQQEQTKNIRHSIDPMVFEVASESLLDTMLPSTKALMARISMLRALNRRARFALPWLPMRSAQEASAILGGLSGFGTSLERAGRTWDVKSQSAVSGYLLLSIFFLLNATQQSDLLMLSTSGYKLHVLHHDCVIRGKFSLPAPNGSF